MPYRPDLTRVPAVPLEEAGRVAARFALPEPLRIADFPGKGNVNRSTYLVSAGDPGNCSEYLLQMLNTDVFADPDAVMDTMIACILAQNRALSEGALPGNEDWEPIRLVATKAGAPYFKTECSGRPQCWRVMARVPRTESYTSLNAIPDPVKRLQIAEEAGRGLALFGFLTAAMKPENIPTPVPGYRDTALYFNQLDSVLEGNRTAGQAGDRMPPDPALRRSTGRFFTIELNPGDYRRRQEDPRVKKLVDTAMDQRSFCMGIQEKLASGCLRRTIVHGDTKLDNFLFAAETGRVKSLVDLDTVMPHTWLSDWGDMARSLVNVYGEREPDPDAIRIDMEIFKAAARGFLRAAPLPPPAELGLMTDAVRIMALELGVRFLADHLRGDTYFRPGAGDPEDLNRIRAEAQFSLFRSLSERAREAEESIVEICRRRKES